MSLLCTMHVIPVGHRFHCVSMDLQYITIHYHTYNKYNKNIRMLIRYLLFAKGFSHGTKASSNRIIEYNSIMNTGSASAVHTYIGNW